VVSEFGEQSLRSLRRLGSDLVGIDELGMAVA
jgi:hypothetical protein